MGISRSSRSTHAGGEESVAAGSGPGGGRSVVPRPPHSASPAAPPQGAPLGTYLLTEAEFQLFRDLIYRLTGIALADAKRALVQSRLQKRLRVHGLSCFQEYYDRVAGLGWESEEVRLLVNCITTNKTDFFREDHHFRFVSDTILPEMIRRGKMGVSPRRLRVWHAGCSTGEEPYTMAMTVAEGLAGETSWDVRLLASDIDTAVLSRAAEAVYEWERVETVPDALLRKYFLRGRGAREGFAKVRTELREQIVFRQINLIADDWPIRPGVRFDLIFCRNVAIYFDRPTQQRLFSRLAERLCPGGYLFIGHSESLHGISDRFENCGRTIYRLVRDA